MSSGVIAFLNYHFRGHQVPLEGGEEAVMFFVNEYYKDPKVTRYFYPTEVEICGRGIPRKDYSSRPDRIQVCVDINRCVVDISVG